MQIKFPGAFSRGNVIGPIWRHRLHKFRPQPPTPLGNGKNQKEPSDFWNNHSIQPITDCLLVFREFLCEGMWTTPSDRKEMKNFGESGCCSPHPPQVNIFLPKQLVQLFSSESVRSVPRNDRIGNSLNTMYIYPMIYNFQWN